jgi:hypothetical protein
MPVSDEDAEKMIAQANAADARADAAVAAKDDLVTAHAAALAAKDAAIQEATDRLAALQGEVDTGLTTIATLQAKVTDLTKQLAGSDGEYKISLSAARLKLLDLAALKAGVMPAELLSGVVQAALTPIIDPHIEELFAVAIARFPDMSTEAQRAVASVLGLEDFLKLPPESFDKALRTMALPAFLALTVDQQTAIITAMGL